MSDRLKKAKKYIVVFLLAWLFPMVFSISWALTPDEVIRLKEAGVSDETIQLMLKQKAGSFEEIRDSQGNVYMRYSTEPIPSRELNDKEEQEKIQRAWEILNGIVIDRR